MFFSVMMEPIEEVEESSLLVQETKDIPSVPDEEACNPFTTISSTSVTFSDNQCKQNTVTIKTTVSWSKLPPLVPSMPVIETVEETTSDDGDSSDEKGTRKLQVSKSSLHHDTKTKLQQLGAFYAGDSIDIPLLRAEENYILEKYNSRELVCCENNKSRNIRLTALAKTVQDWDYNTKFDTSEKEVAASSLPVSIQRSIYNYSGKENIHRSSRKSVTFEEALPNKLPLSPVDDSKSSSSVKERYRTGLADVKIMKSKENIFPLSTDEEKPSSRIELEDEHSNGKQFTAQLLDLNFKWDQVKTPTYTEQNKDPSELSLFERMALFENNGGPAVLPKAPFAMPVPASKLQNKSPQSCKPVNTNTSSQKHSSVCSSLQDHSRSLKTISNCDENSNNCLKLEKEIELDTLKYKPGRDDEKVSSLVQSDYNKMSNNYMHLEKERELNSFKCKIDRDRKKAVSLKQEEFIENHNYVQLKSERKLDCLKNRSGGDGKNIASPVHEELDENFKNYVQLNRESKLYSLKHKPTREKKMIARPIQENFKSLQCHPLHVSLPNLAIQKSTFEYYKDRRSSSFFTHNKNKYLDQSDLPEHDNIEEVYPVLKEINKALMTPPDLGMISSNLSELEVGSDSNSDFENCEINRSDWSDDSHESDNLDFNLEVNSAKTILKGGEAHSKNNSYSHFAKENSPQQSLFHRVSSYRRQQSEARNWPSPVKFKFSTSSQEIEQIDEHLERKLVDEKIDLLEQEVLIEEMHIKQARQAQKICYDSFKFYGSTEHLEAEKLLLYSSQRKHALQAEIRRLKVERRLNPGDPRLTEQGSLCLYDITLPLRIDVLHYAAKDELSYHILCVVRHHEEVLCSSVMSVPGALHSDNMLTFHNKFKFNNLSSDFKISIEIYSMTAPNKARIPHDIKYFSKSNNKEANKLKLTFQNSKGKFISHSSSGAMHKTFLAPAFGLSGHIEYTLQDIQQTQFTLTKESNIHPNPLEGTLELRAETKMCGDIEFRGFLTMYEDISGPAWHRRWCLLKGDKLSYWKYPDDEHKKIPLDTIELSLCTNKEVQLVQRDVCARPNTFELEIVRPSQDYDVNSLVMIRNGNTTTVRHWLSADTKDDRILWCEHINKALALLRAWGVN